MEKKQRCVIIGAAPIHNYEKIRESLNPASDFYIFCDGGLNHSGQLGIAPDLTVGDFDSHALPDLDETKSENALCAPCALRARSAYDERVIVLPREKDDTDAFFAVKEALRRGFTDFLLIGVIGNRLDHSLTNISILLYLDRLELSAKIIDDFSEIQVLKNRTLYKLDDSFAYFSLTAIAGEAKGITIKNAKFPLKNGTISPWYQYGISNEVLPGEVAEIFVKKGKVLLSKIFKE